jgi:oxaloacetate decarboxylase alpha subunit
MTQVKFIDTTLRDGQQSMWALNMRTGMMMPAIADMDAAGFEAIEFFLPTIQLKKMTRDLGEDPWQWLKAGIKGIQKTPLRLHGGYKPHSFSRVPASAGKLLNQKMAEYGITTTRTSHQWNDFEDMKEEVDELRKLGIETVVNLIYSVSPRHTDEYYVARAKSARAIKPYRICFKDVGGLLTPERVRVLLPKILAAVGDITLEFHGHCNNGLGPLNVLEAVRQGITHIHTAIPPLANGSSQPSVFNVEKNLKALGYDPDVDVSVLKPVEAHFTYIAKRENLPIGIPAEYDQSLYHHQVPGGMISNLRFQLQKVGMEHRLQETLEEAVQVRAEFGYPIMVTPLSQFVGSQAAINGYPVFAGLLGQRGCEGYGSGHAREDPRPPPNKGIFKLDAS